jgi:hypothetical protein
VSDEQWEKLQSGGHIYLENMERRDGSGKFSAYVFMDSDTKDMFCCAGHPGKMVECGGITIRLRDKILVEEGYVTKAEMEWSPGIYQTPFVWKDPASGEIKHSFTDPRLSKKQAETERQAEKENTVRRTPEVNRTLPKINRTGPSLKSPSKGIRPKR